MFPLALLVGHAGGSSFHSLGWPSVLVSFSLWPSVIPSVSFLSPFFLITFKGPFLSSFSKTLQSKGKLNTKAGPYYDQKKGTYFPSTFLSHHRDPARPPPLTGSGGPLLHVTKSCFFQKPTMALMFLPSRQIPQTLNVTSWQRNHSLNPHVYLFCVDYFHTLEQLDQTSTAKFSVSWPHFLPNPSS